jgi:sugar lactone lactonase YvrE
MIYSVYHEDTDYMPSMYVTKGSTSELGDIKISLNVATWPEKCTFSGESTLYCAVPQGLPRGAGMYPEIAQEYPDNFYHIDLESGTKTLIASPIGDSASYSANGLSVSDDGSFLYFIDQNTGLLQSIRLK